MFERETDIGTIFDTLSEKRVIEIQDKARRTLIELGIDVDRLLIDAPHGSRVKEHVLYVAEAAPESEAGQAARLLEMTMHYRAYMALPGGEKLLPHLAYLIGRLELLTDILTGQRARKQRRKAGFSSGEERLSERLKDWSAWQAAADEVWARNPLLSVNAAAEKIAPTFGAPPGTIRKRIKKLARNARMPR